MLAVTLGLLQVGATVLSGWTLAWFVCRRWWSFDHWALNAAAYCGLGLLFWSHVIFALTQVGQARRPVLLGLVWIMGALTVTGAITQLVRLGPGEILAGLRAKLRERGSRLFLAASAGYTIWLVVLSALPATAVDELVYHLEVPRQMLAAGGQILFPDNIYAYFPQFGEMFFLFALPISGEPGAHLFHVVFGLLCALAIYGLLRGRVARPYAMLGVVIFCSIPTVIVVSTWAYVDLTFTFYVVVALAGLLRYVETRASRWLVFVALSAGACISIKYTGIQTALLLTLVLLLEHLHGKRASLPFGAFLVPLGALVVASPHLLRNWYLTGWPLFPFQVGPLPLVGAINWDLERARLLYSWFAGFGTRPEGVWGLIQAPVRVFIDARFYDLRLYDGIAGPVFLLTPILIWRIRKQWPVGLLALFALAFLAYWMITTQQVRFLLPALAVMSVLLAIGLDRLRNPLVEKLVWILLLLNIGLAVRQSLIAEPFGVLTGQESLDDYRTRRISLYPVYRSMNQHLTNSDLVVLVGSSNVTYYLDRPFRADYMFEMFRLTKLLESGADSEQIRASFRSLKATHLLLNEFVLGHPQAGLRPAERERLQEFLSRYASLVDRQGNYALVKLIP